MEEEGGRTPNIPSTTKKMISKKCQSRSYVTEKRTSLPLRYGFIACAHTRRTCSQPVYVCGYGTEDEGGTYGERDGRDERTQETAPHRPDAEYTAHLLPANPQKRGASAKQHNNTADAGATCLDREEHPANGGPERNSDARRTRRRLDLAHLAYSPTKKTAKPEPKRTNN